jgi:hypothetical protein
MARFDHVFLHVRSKPVLWPENGAKFGARMGCKPIDDVNELVIDRGRIADDSHALAVKPPGREQPFRSQCDSHAGSYSA